MLLYCSYNIEDSDKNFLADTYRNKSFTALDIMSYFFVQQLLNEIPEMTAIEILNGMPTFNEDIVFTKDNLRVKLDDLVEKGYIQTRKEGRNVFYRLVDDLWKNFKDEELVDLCLYLEFVKNVSPIEMPYYFLEKKLYLYMKLERKVAVDDLNVFSFKHNHLFNSLDNDILLEILRSCRTGKELKVFIDKENEVLVVPIKVIHDSTYGRQYLYCFDKNMEKQRIIRIDKIEAVNCGKSLLKTEIKHADALERNLNECWCTSGIDEGEKEIVIEFRFDEQKEGFILRRIHKEGHGGVIKKKEEGIYEYRLMVRDPNEMIPWIRSFGERAKVISSDGKNTENIISEDWKKAVRNYESL